MSTDNVPKFLLVILLALQVCSAWSLCFISDSLNGCGLLFFIDIIHLFKKSSSVSLVFSIIFLFSRALISALTFIISSLALALDSVSSPRALFLEVGA